MRIFDQYRRDQFSQNGEDFLLEETFQRIGIKQGKYCEFGASDGIFCSNTKYLADQGWAGKLIEVDLSHAKALIDNTMGKDIELYFGPVTVENVNDLVPHDINLLSIDTDNEDYNLWNAYKGQPDVVVIEINSGIPPDEIVVPGNRGASYRAMVMLGISKGYFLLCHTGNCIFVLNKHREQFPEIVGDGLENAEDYFLTKWL